MGGQGFAGNMQSTGRPGGNQRSQNFGQVWYLDQSGKLAVDYVRTGMNNGMETQIVRSHHLEKGMKVITGLASGESASENSAPPRFGRGRMF